MLETLSALTSYPSWCLRNSNKLLISWVIQNRSCGFLWAPEKLAVSVVLPLGGSSGDAQHWFCFLAAHLLFYIVYTSLSPALSTHQMGRKEAAQQRQWKLTLIFLLAEIWANQRGRRDKMRSVGRTPGRVSGCKETLGMHVEITMTPIYCHRAPALIACSASNGRN